MSGWFQRIKWQTIHAKLLANYLLLTTLGTSLMAGYILWSFHAYSMKTRQMDLENWTAAVSESLADALEERDFDRVRVLTKRFGAAETVTLRVFGLDGQLLATSSPETDWQIKNWTQVAGVQAALQSRSVFGIAKGVLTGDDRLYVARPVMRNGQMLGVLRMSITLRQFQLQFSTLVWTVLGALGLTILLCALLSDRLARSLSRPIEIMRNFAIRMGSGHFGDKLTIHQNNELDQLTIELNRMSERLASLDQERRAFLANVSHELRTPISNVQVTVEALRSGADAEPALRDRFLQTVEDETKRLSRLIHDLLDLGRLEAGVTALELHSVSLRYLINRALRALEPRFQEAGILVHQTIVDIQIWGDPERLLQALLNILDNAIKYSASGANIFISSSQRDKQAVVTIQDQGPGIRESDLPRIFEQFYRTDAARKGTGVGLGLAIARKIVEAHGGSITAQSVVGQGSAFMIQLPLKKS